MEQNSGCMSYTKSSPWYTETFRTVGVPPKKKTHIITYSVASVPQNHNINMAGGSLRQIRVKVSIIQHRYEGTRAPYSCMFIHVYIRNRTRPNNISEAVEPAQKSILLSKLKYFPNNYSEKKYISPFSTHHIMNDFHSVIVLSTRHFVSTTPAPLYAYSSPFLRLFYANVFMLVSGSVPFLSQTFHCHLCHSPWWLKTLHYNSVQTTISKSYNKLYAAHKH